MISWGADLWERWTLFPGFTGLSFHWVSCHHHPLPCKPAGKQANYGCALHIPYTSQFPGCVEAGCLLTVGPSGLEPGKPWGQPPALSGWTGQTQMQWDTQERKAQWSRWLGQLGSRWVCGIFCVPDTVLGYLIAWVIWYPAVSVQFSHSVVSDSLQPHEPQHTRPPCPSPTPRVHPNSCPLSRWCHPTISSSVIPFSSCPQSFPASRSLQMSQLFTSGSQSIRVSASTSVLPKNT